MSHRGTETDFELTLIERFEALGYRHVQGRVAPLHAGYRGGAVGSWSSSVVEAEREKTSGLPSG